MLNRRRWMTGVAAFTMVRSAKAADPLEKFEAIGRAEAVRIGPMIQEVPVWLAGNKRTESVPVDRIRFAVGELHKSGSVERTYRSYVPS